MTVTASVPYSCKEYIAKDHRLCQEVNFWTDAHGEAHLEHLYYPSGRRVWDEETAAAAWARIRTDEDWEWYFTAEQQWPRSTTISEALAALEEQLQRVGWAKTFEEDDPSA